LLRHSIPRIWKKRYNIALLAVRPHVSPHNILFGVLDVNEHKLRLIIMIRNPWRVYVSQPC
jgi:hypothetical protein